MENMNFVEQLRKDREMMLKNKYMPKYHYVAPMTHMNDPNGFCYYKGNWHLFYQSKKGSGPFQWGHAYSKDSIHWIDLPNAIEVGPYEAECYSGSVFIDGERAIAAYFGVREGIILAVSDDPLLEKWTKLNGGHAVIPLPKTPEERAKYSVHDSFIWKKDSKYYILSGDFRRDSVSGKREREMFLFESEDLINWTYLHPFLDHDVISPHDDDGACPYFLPLEDRHIMFNFSHRSGPKYTIGIYDKENNKFRVTDGDSLVTSASFFGGLLAPSVYYESEHSLRAIYNISYYKFTDTLQQIMSLPRTVSYIDSDHDLLAFNVIDDIKCLRKTESAVTTGEKELAANEETILTGFEENCGEYILEFEAKNIPALEIRVLRSPDASEYTSLSIYRQRGNTYRKLMRPGFSYRQAHETVVVLSTLRSSLDGESQRRVPEMQSVYVAPDEKLKVRIFVDKSVVEVFLNDKLAIAARVYPTEENSTGVSVTPIGQSIKLLSAVKYSYGSIYE